LNTYIDSIALIWNCFYFGKCIISLLSFINIILDRVYAFLNLDLVLYWFCQNNYFFFFFFLLLFWFLKIINIKIKQFFFCIVFWLLLLLLLLLLLMRNSLFNLNLLYWRGNVIRKLFLLFLIMLLKLLWLICLLNIVESIVFISLFCLLVILKIFGRTLIVFKFIIWIGH